MPIVLLFISLLFCCLLPAQDSTYVYEYKIAQTKLVVEEQCFRPCKSGVIYIHLHDNELTSLEVANEYLSQHGGRLIRLKNAHERIVETVLDSNSYCFDPNRIYSRKGLDASVLMWSDITHATVTSDIEKFSRQFLWRYVDPARLIISLHNNTDTNYSMLQVQKSLLAKTYFGKIFINPLMDEDDFMLTTDSLIYEQIAAKNINVIWEKADIVEDDGSLSVYAGRRRIPYINVEAQHDHKAEQLMMMDALAEIIKTYHD